MGELFVAVVDRMHVRGRGPAVPDTVLTRATCRRPWSAPARTWAPRHVSVPPRGRLGVEAGVGEHHPGHEPWHGALPLNQVRTHVSSSLFHHAKRM